MFERIRGQSRIVRELSAISFQLKNIGSINILFRGQAGSGKTKLATEFLFSICGRNYSRQIPAKNGGKFIFTMDMNRFRGHFIDEIHTCKNIETCYPIMDSGKFIMVFASNEYGNLPEALTSRCIVFNLDNYTLDELASIVVDQGNLINFNVTRDVATNIARCSRGNPRVAEMLIKRISYIIKCGYYQSTPRGISAALKDIGIYNGGYTENDMRYLKFLSEINLASLSTISHGIGVDENTIKLEIEPFLISHGHILIQRNGRRFISWKMLKEKI